MGAVIEIYILFLRNEPYIFGILYLLTLNFVEKKIDDLINFAVCLVNPVFKFMYSKCSFYFSLIDRMKEVPLENTMASSQTGEGITRSCVSWLRSLPVHIVALMLVGGLVCALDPDILKRLANFTLTISPELRYVNGPPTI